MDGATTYHLTSIDYYISARDELARFLETATFGITQSKLHDLENLLPILLRKNAEMDYKPNTHSIHQPSKILERRN